MHLILYSISGLVFLIFHLVFEFDALSSLGLSIFAYWISRLISFSRLYLPIKELFLSLYSLQYLFSPAFMYNGMGEYTGYKMKIPVDHYFSFSIPALILFSLGFAIFFKPSNLKIDRKKIDIWLSSNIKIPYMLIIVGLVSPLLYYILPISLHFIIYVLISLKFIGLFILISSSSKPKIGLIIFIFTGVFISAFAAGMFHDLLTWIVMLGVIINIRYNPSFYLKFLGILVFVFFVMFIQSIKDDLRSRIWGSHAENVSIELLKSASSDAEASKGGILALESLGPSLNRINQGWVLASVIDNVPLNIEHSKGLLIKEYLIAAIMPRFLFPDKMKGGDTKYFNLYSGHFVGEETVMVLGVPAEAYIEFAGIGSFIYIFLFGALYGGILKVFSEKSKEFPILVIFTVVVFIYPMRPDCDTQTSLGHLFKTCFLLYFTFLYFRPRLSILNYKKIAINKNIDQINF